MKKLIFLLLLSPLAFASNSMRNIEEYRFKTLIESPSVKFEEIKLHDELFDYLITLNAINGKAEFEWTCALFPFFYSPELEQLSQTGWYDLNITLNDGGVSFNHYTVHPNGAMISKNYIANHFPALLESIINGNNMTITLENVDGEPQYKFENHELLQVLQTFIEKCELLEY